MQEPIASHEATMTSGYIVDLLVLVTCKRCLKPLEIHYNFITSSFKLHVDCCQRPSLQVHIAT